MKLSELIRELQSLSALGDPEVMSSSDVRGMESPRPIRYVSHGEMTEYEVRDGIAALEGRAGELVIRLNLDD